MDPPHKAGCFLSLNIAERDAPFLTALNWRLDDPAHDAHAAQRSTHRNKSADAREGRARVRGDQAGASPGAPPLTFVNTVGFPWGILWS
jgi:hypothetical protein